MQVNSERRKKTRIGHLRRIELLVSAQKADVARLGRGHTWQGYVIVYPSGPIIPVLVLPIIVVLLILFFCANHITALDHMLLNTQ
jgi:hypothetical protein